MFKCNCCGRTFDEPDSYTENVGEFWGAPAYEEFSCCPYCGDDCFEEFREPEFYDVVGVNMNGTCVDLGRFTCLEDAVETAHLEDDNYECGCEITDDLDNEVEWK